MYIVQYILEHTKFVTGWVNDVLILEPEFAIIIQSKQAGKQ